MNPIRTLLLAAALVAGVPTAHAQAQVQPVERIAAVVNEDVILQSELDRAMANILAQYAANPEQLPPREILARQVLERLVLTRLQVARAQESGIRVSDQEVDQALGAIAEQNRMSPDQLQAQLAKDGMSMADFRSSVRDEIVIKRLKQSFAQSRIQVSEAEVDAIVAQQGAAGGGNQYRLANILVALPEGATLEAAYNRMRTARQQEAIAIRAEGQKEAQIIRGDADGEAARIYAASFGKDPEFYDFYRAMQSYRQTFLGENNQGGTSVILSPDNEYLRHFKGG